jgi:hyaluronan synthase
MKSKLLLNTGILLLIICCMILMIDYPLIFSYFTLFYMLVVAVVAYGYRNCEADCTPSCDVLIPAYNEGKHVYKTIKSIMKSDYPDFHVIAVDDGSKDDTRQWLQKAKEEFPAITVILCDRNRGKKHALVEAIRASHSEIIVTVDSDSTVAPDSIANLVKPFRDKKVGAVAGNICVQNLSNGLIPKLMDIIFVFSYEILRSSQSRFGVVLCTPGALSAYRRTAVEPLLPEWLKQRFLGKKTSIGEDRALTCMLLKQQWNVLYQESAKAYTNMPETYTGLCKMLLRWVRGDIRENILFAPYIFKNFSLLSLKSVGLAFHYIIFNIGILSPVVISPLLLIYFATNYASAGIILFYMLIMTLLWSIVPTIIYARKKSLLYSFHSITYSLFSLFFLMWIPLYALFTLNNNQWLTRK